jgi:uncharacterized membrane protein YkoI
MKIPLSTFVLSGLLAFSLGVSADKEKKLTEQQVPKNVQEAFQKLTPDAKDVKYKEEVTDGKAFFEIEFKQKSKELEALYSAEGLLIKKEEEIKITELPALIIQVIGKHYPKALLKEAEKILKPDEAVGGYEVEIEDGKKEVKLELDNSGKVLKTEANKD